ncbi:TIGR01777 family protein [bacterium]|nr:TIGR01777 family protein [bacterium]
MKWLILGGTGKIGSRLISRLLQRGETVVLSTRSAPRKGEWRKGVWTVFACDDEASPAFIEAFGNADILVNLAGEEIASHPWTEERKEEIVRSRVQTTSLLSFLMAHEGENIPKVWLNASAVGIYGSGVGTAHEETPSVPSFLSETCQAWEAAVESPAGVRTAILRFGVVLMNEGGAFPKIQIPFRFGFGAWLGSGNQYFPWVHVHDAVEAILQVARNPEAIGAINIVAPVEDSAKSFALALNDAWGRPRIQMVPPFKCRWLGGLYRAMNGERSVLALEGRPVSAEKLLGLGYRFQYPKAIDACSALLAST